MRSNSVCNSNWPMLPTLILNLSPWLTNPTLAPLSSHPSGSTTKATHIRGFGIGIDLDSHYSRSAGNFGHLCTEAISNLVQCWLSHGCPGGPGKPKFDPICNLHDLQSRRCGHQPHLCQCRLYAVCRSLLFLPAALSFQEGRGGITFGRGRQ